MHVRDRLKAIAKCQLALVASAPSVKSNCVPKDEGEEKMIFWQARKQTGATLLEVLAFLGIASLVLVGATAMYKSAQATSNATSMVRQLDAIRSGLKTLYASQGWYTTNSNLVPGLVAAGAIPDDMRVRLNFQLIPAFGGGMGMSSYATIGGAGGTFVINWMLVPAPICIKALGMAAKSWQTIMVNYGTIYQGQTVTPAQAGALCNQGDYNTMTFTST